MSRRRLIAVLAVVAPMTLVLGTLATCRPAPSKASQPISLEEAEVLIYLLPQAHELRAQAMDVGWELETGKSYNQDDFYVFWVVNSKRPYAQGSVTVGYFAVNKHSAELWSLDTNQFVSTPEIEGVQKIIRNAHLIDEHIIQQYHSRRPDILTNPNTEQKRPD